MIYITILCIFISLFPFKQWTFQIADTTIPSTSHNFQNTYFPLKSTSMLMTIEQLTA